MPSKSKAKGNRAENLVVKRFEEKGIPCKRAWGSNGAALGEAETVDNVAILPTGDKLRIQVKSRKRVAGFMTPPEGADCTILKADREEPLIVLPLHLFLSFASMLQSLEEQSIEPQTVQHHDPQTVE